MDALRSAVAQPWIQGRLERSHRAIADRVTHVQRQFQRWHSSKISIATYLLIVGSVSIYDFVLTIVYAPCLYTMEENPIGRFLMGLDRVPMHSQPIDQAPDLTLFLTMKSIGTIIVLAVMLGLMVHRSRIGHPISMGVSIFQLGLGMYLAFACYE